MNLKKVLLFVLAVTMLFTVAGCTKNPDTNGKTDTTTESKKEEITSVNQTTEAPTTMENTEETTPEQTKEPTTEAPTEPYVGAWTLLSNVKLTPQKSGNQELDTLIEELLAKLVTDDMNGYKKAWVCYEYLIDNISYSRGMDANTGMYSVSDPATTPKEILWATDLLNSGMGCCYHYSSAYVYILRAIGFEAHLVSGNVPAYKGGLTPHCWLYVTIDGINYTFDPDLDMNYYTRDISNGIENPAKDRFFCVPVEKMSYFYKAETYHTN